jgi:hypothetical protein
MFGEKSFWSNSIVADLLILSVLTARCVSALSTRTNIIFQNQSISDGQTIISLNKKFELGFFSPGASTYRYVGIWYTSDPKRAVVWVANRNNPLLDNLGILRFDNSSNLVILDGRGKSFTVANGTGIQYVDAAIQDDGNFVLKSISNPRNIIWGSFYFPTDTWLPGMNITVGSKLVTSWKSSDDPAVGDYSFGPGVTNASELRIWWNGINFWTSRHWDGDMNSLIPELTYLDVIPVSFQCDNLSCMYTPNPKNRLTKVVLDPDGSLNLAQFDSEAQSWTLLWRQPISCDVSNLCGNFGICNMSLTSHCQCPKGFAPQDIENYRKGCTRQIPLQCSSDKFFKMPGMLFPDNRAKLSVMGNSECQMACTVDCSCMAYAYSLLDGCSLWHGNLTNMKDGYNGSEVGTLHFRLAASELESASSSGS